MNLKLFNLNPRYPEESRRRCDPLYSQFLQAQLSFFLLPSSFFLLPSSFFLQIYHLLGDAGAAGATTAVTFTVFTPLISLARGSILAKSV